MGKKELVIVHIKIFQVYIFLINETLSNVDVQSNLAVEDMLYSKNLATMVKL